MKNLSFINLFLFSCLLLQLEAKASTISLSWDASTSTNVGGYKIFYGQTSGNYPNMIDVGNTTTTIIPNLPEKTEIFIAAKAYNKDRTLESPFSLELSTITPPDVIVPPPPQIPNFTQTPRGFQVILTPDKTLIGVTNWKWTLPGSYMSTITNTVYKPIYPVYKTAGTYDVTLEVIIDGVVQSYTQKIVVGN